MRRAVMVLGLALSLLGCADEAPTPRPSRGAQVPLLIDPFTEPSCFLTHRIVDVIADPTTGTPTDPTGTQFMWLTGFTAWRVGSEVEVLDADGGVVLTTGGRYWMCPASVDPWVVGAVFPCPPGSEIRPFGNGRLTRCEVGAQVD